MRFDLAALASCFAVLGSVPAVAADLQVAIVFDTGLPTSRQIRVPSDKSTTQSPSRVRGELEAFERALQGAAGTLDLALVRCRRSSHFAPQEMVVERDFGSGVTGIAAHLDALSKRARDEKDICRPNFDIVDAALDGLTWSEGTKKRLVLVSGFDRWGGESGRASLEQVVHRAERAGIVVHAVEFVPERYARYFGFRLAGRTPELERLSKDVRRFLEQPIAPLGRVPHELRHATILSGGSYAVGILFDDHWSLRRSYSLGKRSRKGRVSAGAPMDDQLRALDEAAGLDRAYGPLTNGKDALDDLAEGRLRPAEVGNESLPRALHDIDLEPLLDAVWDFVDARRALSALIAEVKLTLRGEDVPAGRIGRELAEALAAERRLPPSRR